MCQCYLKIKAIAYSPFIENGTDLILQLDTDYADFTDFSLFICAISVHFLKLQSPYVLKTIDNSHLTQRIRNYPHFRADIDAYTHTYAHMSKNYSPHR